MIGNIKEKYIIYIVLIIWVIGQVSTLCYYFEAPQLSDAAGYQKFALECYNNGTWYPDKVQIYNNYIFNPGYVNYLLLHLHVFGSFALVGIFNILLNILIVFELFILTKYFFDKATGYIAVALYCILPSNTLLVQPFLTEIPFLAIILGATCLIRKNNLFMLLGAGILFAVANLIRPIVVLFLLPAFIYMFINKYKLKNYIVLISSILICVLLIGFSAQKNSGYFIYQATTGGFNLIEGANDNMNGGYEKSCFEKGNIGYIENIEKLTFEERDSIWKARSVEWILHHPVKYIAYIPVKIARTWWGDDYLNGFLFETKTFYETNPTFSRKLGRVVSGMVFSITYYLIMICFILSFFKFRKKIKRELWFLLIPVVLGTAMQALIYGSQRYHYPYMPVIISFAAYWISVSLKNRVPNGQKNV